MEASPSHSDTQRLSTELTSNLLSPSGQGKHSKYQQCRKTVYSFLERPATKIATAYHIFNLLLIVGSIILNVLSTVEHFEKDFVLLKVIFYYEMSLLSLFSAEYILRAWSCSFINKYKSFRGKLRFMRTFYMLVDAFVIISTLVTAVLHVKTAYFSMLRITRVLQVFRILRMDRQRGDIRTMIRVVYQHRKELVTCYFVGFIILFSGSYLVYICEKYGKNGSITNMADGLYWGMITVTSVGYGDFSPSTWGGKAVTGIFALVGTAFFGLPAGVLGAGFALQVSKQKKQKRYLKVRNPAALAIQSCWRNYSVRKEMPNLQATWEKYFPHVNFKHNHPQYYDFLHGVKSEFKLLSDDELPSQGSSQSNGLETSKRRFFLSPSGNFLSKLNAGLDKRPKESQLHVSKGLMSNMMSLSIDPMDPAMRERLAMKCLPEAFNNSLQVPTHERKKNSLAFLDVMKEKPKEGIGSEDILASQVLNSNFKGAIRFILRVKYWTSVKNFKNIRYPFVNVQDIMEKNMQSHAETLVNLRELQAYMAEFRKELQDMRAMLVRRNPDFGENNINLEEDNLGPRKQTPLISESKAIIRPEFTIGDALTKDFLEIADTNV